MNMFVDLLSGAPKVESRGTASARRKIWEMDQAFRCPVVGICLSIKEQHALCRKVGADVQGKSDFDVHEMIVNAISEENSLSIRLENLLTRKYEASCSAYLNMSEEEFIRCWEELPGQGPYDALLWAAAVRSLTPSALTKVFGILHMTMHEQVRGHSALKTELAKIEEKLFRVRTQNKAVEKHNAALAADNDRLHQELDQMREEMHSLIAEHSATAQTGAMPDDAGGEEFAALLEELEKKLQDRDEELLVLHELLDETEKERIRIQEEFSAHLALDASLRKACAGPDCVAQNCTSEECTPQCPSYSLCEKRVLIVGGIERMEASYRKFVEERGGTFEYHAGHMKSGGRALENSVQRADLVLCPVNCNSHGACLKVKNLGKKYKKPVHMLSNFSLSTLARTVEQLAQTN